MSGYRLDTGGRIDRSRTLSGTFDGRSFIGHPGDSLASALMANGVDIVGRSFKLSRPRGFLGAGLDEANAIVTLGKGAFLQPNIKATEVSMEEGLTARVPNAFPNARFDMGGLLGAFDRFLPAGFYYKTFFWPNWHLFEPTIRKMAGMGRLPGSGDPQEYEHHFKACDTLVIGGGPCGLSAALTAGRAGKTVILVELEAELGGHALWLEDYHPVKDMIKSLRELPNVTILTRSCAFGRYDHGLIAVLRSPGTMLKIRAGHTLLATGALERPLLFENNDLPGVMLLSAAERFARQYGVASGRNVVVAGLDVASRADALTALGINVVEVVNYPQARLIRAKGRKSLRAVEIETESGRHWVDADAVLMSAGWTPNVHLLRHAEGKIRFDDRAQTFVPDGAPTDLTCIGGCAGRDAVPDGQAVVAGDTRPIENHPPGFGFYVHPDAHPRKVWIDFHNDVRLSDIRTASDEGFQSVEHLKRYTTLGMASDQGRTSNVNAILTLGNHLETQPQAIGTTRFRPPFKPVRLGAFAGADRGKLLQPLRRTIWHDEAIAEHALLADYAGWHRAVCFPKPGESEPDAVHREALAVRETVGLFDASPLGKIEVWGPDAATFLDRVYAGTMSTLKTGRVRYGLMMTEQGAIFDDGICARLSDDLFLVGTTSGNAGHVLDHLEEWHQREWSDLRLSIIPVTEQWATLSINGPRARDLLERLEPKADISAKVFKHMQAIETTLGRVPARILRVSFTGELCFEVSVPALQGKTLWSDALEAGRDLGVNPFGIESLMVMRIEKGFAHIGSETDGDTIPDDLGYGGMVSNKKSDCIGRRSTERPNARRPDRRQMVGLEPLDHTQPLSVGAHIVDAKGTRGWVSSASYSPTLGRSVALAMINGGRALEGNIVTLYHDGQRVEARVCAPCAIDPKGERLRG